MCLSFISFLTWRHCSCQVLGDPLPYDSLEEIRGRMSDVAPNLVRYGDVEEANYFKQASELAKVSLLQHHK